MIYNQHVKIFIDEEKCGRFAPKALMFYCSVHPSNLQTQIQNSGLKKMEIDSKADVI